MEKIHYDYIDVDRTVIEPSPQRVRNILTLEERVRAIQAYECRPMYTKVAKMFNCSWEQIKNIIANRESIMSFYKATKNHERSVDPNKEDIKRRKIKFLGECVYEFIQRVQFHTKADLTEDLIRMKAMEFRDVIQIDNFNPNRAWINHFKATYNFSLSNRQIVITRTPPGSLDLKDIMMYCSKHKQKVEPVIRANDQHEKLYRTTTRISVSNQNDATLEEVMQRRRRKINFLEKALYEYMQRAQYHHKIPLTEDLLRKIACDLKDMLKVDNFFPDKAWLNHFRNRYNFSLSQGIIVITHTPPLSMDLKDILSYCSRNENKHQTPNKTTVKLTPKELPKVLAPTLARPQPIVQIHTMNLGQTLPQKLQHQQNVPPMKVKEEIIDVDDDEEKDVKPNVSELLPGGVTKRSPSEVDCLPPPMKIQKIESTSDENTSEIAQNSPGHWSEHSDDEPLPKHVRNYAEALKLLTPLEEFAMLEENYRVIGLVSQLEEIFKNPPKK